MAALITNSDPNAEVGTDSEQEISPGLFSALPLNIWSLLAKYLIRCPENINWMNIYELCGSMPPQLVELLPLSMKVSGLNPGERTSQCRVYIISLCMCAFSPGTPVSYMMFG